MPLRDLREFLLALEEAGELKRVKAQVDWKYELAGWARHCYDMKPRGPALLFENIKGYGPHRRFFTGGLATYRRIALALDLPPDMALRELIAAVKERISRPVAPRVVKDGPVHQNVMLEDEVDLLSFPVPWWTPRDGGRFIGTWHANVTRNTETGITNLGLYRMQLLDKRRAAIGFGPYADAHLHYTQRQARNEPLEMAVVIGAEETVVMASTAGVPENVEEYEIAGGLRQQPLELVRCKTVDLYVPATAEIVLEGRILPRERVPEGPFGEHPGYHGGSVRMRPVFEVSAVTFRNNPIFRGTFLGKPTDEGHIAQSISHSACGLMHFQRAGPPGVKAVFCPPWSSPSLSAIIQMRPYYVGHSRDVGRFWLSGPIPPKYVVIVDEDIDPFDLSQVWWAIITRTRASRDFEVLPFGHISRSDPSVSREGEFTDYLIIDATKKLDYSYRREYGGHWAPVSMPPDKVMDLVALKWRKYIRGEAVPEKKIDQAARELSQLEKEWAAWRNNSYVLSPEEQETEIPKSYPRMAKE